MARYGLGEADAARLRAAISCGAGGGGSVRAGVGGASLAESGRNPDENGDGPGGVRGAGAGGGGLSAPVDGGDAVYGEFDLRDAPGLAGRAVCVGGPVSDGGDEQGRVYVAPGLLDSGPHGESG